MVFKNAQNEGKGPSTKEIQSYYDSYLRSMSTIRPRPGVKEGSKRKLQTMLISNKKDSVRVPLKLNDRINSPGRFN